MSALEYDAILTVPHGFRPTDDIIAYDVGKRVAKILREMGYRIAFHYNMRPREKIDMNRRVSKNTQFRRAIRKSIARGAKLLFDCHSFCPQTTQMDWSPNEILLVLMPDSSDIHSAKYFIRKYASYGVMCKSVETGRVNDIIIEAFDNNIPAVLVEHNEAIDVDEITEIDARIISQFIDECNRRVAPTCEKCGLKITENDDYVELTTTSTFSGSGVVHKTCYRQNRSRKHIR